MSKSTPISSLPNTSKSQPYEERENQLVKEILNEIDGEDNKKQAKIAEENRKHMMEQQAMDAQRQQVMEMERQQIQEERARKVDKTQNINDRKDIQEGQEMQEMQEGQDMQEIQEMQKMQKIQEMQEMQEMQDIQDLKENKILESIENDNFIDKITNMIKQPIIVGVIVILLSLPFLNSTLENFVNSKPSMVSYSVAIILIVKGLIGSTLFYVTNKSI